MKTEVNKIKNMVRDFVKSAVEDEKYTSSNQILRQVYLENKIYSFFHGFSGRNLYNLSNYTDKEAYKIVHLLCTILRSQLLNYLKTEIDVNLIESTDQSQGGNLRQYRTITIELKTYFYEEYNTYRFYRLNSEYVFDNSRASKDLDEEQWSENASQYFIEDERKRVFNRACATLEEQSEVSKLHLCMLGSYAFNISENIIRPDLYFEVFSENVIDIEKLTITRYMNTDEYAVDIKVETSNILENVE